jgi:hypothetical protein
MKDIHLSWADIWKEFDRRCDEGDYDFDWEKQKDLIEYIVDEQLYTRVEVMGL